VRREGTAGTAAGAELPVVATRCTAVGRLSVASLFCVHPCVALLLLQVSEGIDFSDKAGRGVVITGEHLCCLLHPCLQHPCIQLLSPHGSASLPAVQKTRTAANRRRTRI
jgi:hypothetical protein